jgi:hypothetical protein
MPDQAFPRLLYRGFAARRRIDFNETLLSASFPGGYREDIVVGSVNGLRSWQIGYNRLYTDLYVTVPGGHRVSRLDYIWQLYVESKREGNRPIVFTDPHERKDYLCYFPQNVLDINRVNHELSNTSLEIEQVFVRGVNTLEDGSLGETEGNPDEL